jgi:4-diphosphocytidyl-2-C-methyl-D-erythritol kinase
VSCQRASICKINLLLNILGKRPDGYHELETVLQPVPLTDELEFDRRGRGVRLTCNHPSLPVDRGNLVFRAAEAFLHAAGAGAEEGVAIHLEKRLPLAAGLGAGSANAATTLRALNDLFGEPLSVGRLSELASGLGSDVPFFLQDGPALATGRGELIEPLPSFELLRGCGLFLVHPGFGIATPWAYEALKEYPERLNGRPGRARELIGFLRAGEPRSLGTRLYNSLEGPVLRKYPLLELFQEFFRETGALAALLSGSGSATFAICGSEAEAMRLRSAFEARFGTTCWVATAALQDRPGVPQTGEQPSAS